MASDKKRMQVDDLNSDFVEYSPGITKQKDLYFNSSLYISEEEKDLEELHDDPLLESYNSYSLTTSTSTSMNNSNVSSVSTNNDNQQNITNNNNVNLQNYEIISNNLNEIRNKYLNEIKNKMNAFQNGLSLWNEGGFIPLLTNFMFFIDEANNEINNLLKRLDVNVFFIKRFVKLYKIQQNTLNDKNNKINDLNFEINDLRNENELLRSQLFNLTNLQNKSNTNINKPLINKMRNTLNKHQNKEDILMMQLENIHNTDLDQLQINDIFCKIENEKQKQQKPKQKRIKSRSVRLPKRKTIIKNNNNQNSLKLIKQKVLISRSRSYNKKNRRISAPINIRNNNIQNEINKNNLSMSSINESPIATIPKKIQHRKSFSVIRRPSASLKRLSLSSTMSIDSNR